MPEFGYFLSCEEHGPAELVEQARMAEQAGFDSLWISDHYHPWNDRQGQSPPTGCGPTSSCRESSHSFRRPPVISNRRPNLSPRSRWRPPCRAATIRTPTSRP